MLLALIVASATLNEQRDRRPRHSTARESQGSTTPLRLKYWNSSSVHILASVDCRVTDDVDGTQKHVSQPCRMRFAAVNIKAEGNGFSLGTESIWRTV